MPCLRDQQFLDLLDRSARLAIQHEHFSSLRRLNQRTPNT
jgi:hypothetical protein